MIEKPIHRSNLRRKLGKEFYILKRKMQWHFGKTDWARSRREELFQNQVFHHKSLILRPLKNVDMYLQENKRTNLALATAQIDKIIINPGETFSFWKLVGRTTKRKGYLTGLILNQGKIDTDIGGGLCQLGNLLFWLFAHSALTITERYRHGYDVFPDVNRKVPFGAGATLSYNYIDLQVENNTKVAYQIHLWLDKTHLNGQLLSDEKLNTKFRIEERNHLFKQQYWGRYTRHNQIFQIQTENDVQISEKLLVENHAIMMYSPLLSTETRTSP